MGDLEPSSDLLDLDLKHGKRRFSIEQLSENIYLPESTFIFLDISVLLLLPRAPPLLYF
jgi:hypothetical protein